MPRSFVDTRVVSPVVSPRTWLAAIHVVLDLFIGAFSFTFIVTGLSLAAGLAITVVLAVPVLWITLAGSDLFGRMERARFRALLGVEIPNVAPPPAPTAWARVWNRFTSAASWKRAAYALLLFPLGLVGFLLVVGSWGGALTLLSLPASIHALPGDTAHLGLFDIHAGVGAWVAGAVGLVGLVVAAWITRGWAALDVQVGRGLLGLTTAAVLEQRVDTLEATRSQAVDAAETERRRIERDLHDGAQQRLVALAIDLGMARDKFDDDPDAARLLIDHAHQESKRALVELRDLAKGIHPVALTDRGLPGAIPGLADRCPVPVEVWIDVPRRPSPSIEGMAYFIVSESLTNVTKHGHATRAAVDVEQQADRLMIRVSDDGVGGADLASGSGLRGLADRAASVDGSFEVSSPVGGPTVVRAELPCAS